MNARRSVSKKKKRIKQLQNQIKSHKTHLKKQKDKDEQQQRKKFTTKDD